MNRRAFLQSLGAVTASASLLGPLMAAESKPGNARRLKRGIMWGTVGVKGSTLEKMQAVKAAGFEGAEMNSHMNQQEVLQAKEATGLVIPSVCCSTHWSKPVTHSDPKIREEGLEGLRQSLRDAKAYGASSVLFVPGVVNDEVSYQDAYSRSIVEIRKAIPLAEELGINIALENVWNHFLLSPLEAARYVDGFDSPRIGWHFDVGNIVNYGWPEQWIRVLGKRIQKVHFKEFSRKKRDNEGLWKGFAAPLTEGDVNWPGVMKALDEIGYNSWVITEQGGGNTPEGLKDLVTRVDKILDM